jgi:hypothetical protein
MMIGIALICLILLLFTFFHFSYKETPYPDVYIQKLGEKRYELTFRYQVKVSGNMHGPSLPFSGSRTHDRTEWFYVMRNTGQIDASKVVLTRYRACNDSLYWQEAMKGTIEFFENRIIFSIEMPRFDLPDGTSTNTVQRYVQWEHNGEYNLINEKPPAIETQPYDYRPTSCDV